MKSSTKKRDKLAKIAAVIAIIIAIFFLYIKLTSPKPNHDIFAKCLTDKGAKFYGAEWCPHCQNQKGLFGSSVQYIDFIDCDINSEECDQAGIEGYPTWIINRELYTGEQSLTELSSLTGCALN